MTFPVYLLGVHPHPVFEMLGYLVGGQAYLRLRARRGDTVGETMRGWVVVAAIVGGLIGAKLLHIASDLSVLGDPDDAIGGKSIVGALVGAVTAVEWTKRRLGVVRSTGDLFAVPAALGIAVGRIGCFLTGLDDHTYGLPTGLLWGVDFGDGVPRHPTQLYEIAFLLPLALLLWRMTGRPHREGAVFALFMAAYLGFRLFLEAIKPGVFVAGLNAIQWVCLAALAYYGAWALRRREMAVG